MHVSCFISSHCPYVIRVCCMVEWLTLHTLPCNAIFLSCRYSLFQQIKLICRPNQIDLLTKINWFADQSKLICWVNSLKLQRKVIFAAHKCLIHRQLSDYGKSSWKTSFSQQRNTTSLDAHRDVALNQTCPPLVKGGHECRVCSGIKIPESSSDVGGASHSCWAIHVCQWSHRWLWPSRLWFQHSA